MSNGVYRQGSIETFFYQKLMMNAISGSMLESTSTFDNDNMENGASKSTVLEPTIKHLMK